jgi:stringent starvation protein B
MDATFKPYLIRALYEWCLDYGHEPYFAAAVDSHCTVPMDYVNQNQIVLDISPESIKDLDLGLEAISFQARFSGVVHNIYVPMNRVIGLFPAHDQDAGVFFEPTESNESINTAKSVKADEKNEKIPSSLAKNKIVRVK